MKRKSSDPMLSNTKKSYSNTSNLSTGYTHMPLASYSTKSDLNKSSHTSNTGDYNHMQQLVYDGHQDKNGTGFSMPSNKIDNANNTSSSVSYSSMTAASPYSDMTNASNTQTSVAYNNIQTQVYPGQTETPSVMHHHSIYQYATHMSYVTDPALISQYNSYYAAQTHPQTPPQPPLPPPIYFDPSQPPPPPLPPGQPNDVTARPPLPPSTGNWSSQSNNNQNNTTSNRRLTHNNQRGVNNSKYRQRGQLSQYTKVNNNITSSSGLACTSLSSDGTDHLVNDTVTVNKKSKRKSMSNKYTRKTEWDREDALKAISLENEYNKLQKLPMLLLKFPDPELNKDIVKGFSSKIDNVHFQHPSTARYCFVTLSRDANVKDVEKEISNLDFGIGKIIVKKHNYEEKIEVAPEEIDPYTLYIGNLPTNVTVSAVKENFPTAQRIDIGYAQKMKYTRYAFIRYQSITESMDAFRNTFNLEMESRNLIVRFRRQKGNVGLPGETKVVKAKLQAITASNTKSDEGETQVRDTSDEQPMLTDIPVSHFHIDINEVLNEPLLNNQEMYHVSDVPPIEKETVTEGPCTSNTVDSKTNVLEEADKLIESMAIEKGNKDQIKEEANCEKSNGNDILNVTVKNEPEDDDWVEPEEDIVDEDSDFEDLGDDDEDDDDVDAEIDDDDKEEDDEDDKEEDDKGVSKYQLFHWDRIRQKELMQKDIKPNIDQLNAASVTQEIPSKSQSTTKSSTLSKNNDYDDLYNDLNPDDDLEF